MDAYPGLSVDDLLNLPTDDFLSSDCPPHRPSSSAAPTHFQQHSLPTPANAFDDIPCVPAEDAAELEWLSSYMDDSFDDFPANSLTAASESFHSSVNAAGRPSADNRVSIRGDAEVEGENLTKKGGSARRCTHCASEKTPQWRTGPLGPKTLCNACGVRFKSGRLVPEYRPAASPTFVLTQHSNSHRKVLELRRQKEMQHQQQQEAAYGCHFRVC